MIVEYSQILSMFDGWGRGCVKLQVGRLLVGGYIHWMESGRIVTFCVFFFLW